VVPPLSSAIVCRRRRHLRSAAVVCSRRRHHLRSATAAAAAACPPLSAAVVATYAPPPPHPPPPSPPTQPHAAAACRRRHRCRSPRPCPQTPVDQLSGTSMFMKSDLFYLSVMSSATSFVVSSMTASLVGPLVNGRVDPPQNWTPQADVHLNRLGGQP
jgi:hypothetical protein